MPKLEMSDAIIKIKKNKKSIRIDIDTLTPLGKVWTQEIVNTAILQASMDIPNMSFIIKDGSDRYYHALSESLEKRIKSVETLLPDIQIGIKEI